jgi:hypothetical protein
VCTHNAEVVRVDIVSATYNSPWEATMGNEASSLKKAAVLTALAMVMAGAEVSETRAATVTQVRTFDFVVVGGGPVATVANTFFPFF